MTDMDKKNEDYHSFLISSDTQPDEKVSNQVFNFIENDLNPAHPKIAVKLFSIQALVGILTLTFCPQFNLSLTNRYELFHFFHHTFGNYICMLLCGSIFIGTGAIFSALILKKQEIEKIKSSKFLYYMSISGIAISAFLVLGSEVYFDLALTWFVGATAAGVFFLDISHFFRFRLGSHS
ncbi:MAG: hypothetical protein HOE90_21150 [Bacteriovoracaceae bacterium]|jgi:hypothetical protein|nr:hypothetical protein [Bacteriovoracaceae bacterium]